MISVIVIKILHWLYVKPISFVQSLMNLFVAGADRFNERKHAQMPATNLKDPKFQGALGYARIVKHLLVVLVILTYTRTFIALLHATGGVLLLLLSLVVLTGALAIWGIFAITIYGLISEIVEFYQWVASKIS